MHVAAEVGFWHNPKTLFFARTVRDPNGGTYILRWREFVLLHGDHEGHVSGYSVDEIAAYVGWPGTAAALLKAFGSVQVMEKHRDGTLVYPGWQRTETGRYAEMREWDRRRQRDRRRKESEGEEPAKSPPSPPSLSDSASTDVQWTSTDGPRTSNGFSGVSKEGRPPDGSAGPPEAPPAGGGESAAALWEWMAEIHPKPRDPETCKRLLARLTPEQVTHLRHALPVQVASTSWKKNMRFVPTTLKYVREQQWLEIRLRKPKSSEPQKPREPSAAELAAKAAEEEQRERLRSVFERRVVLKERLRGEGVREDELEDRLERELEREQAEREAPPPPPPLVSAEDVRRLTESTLKGVPWQGPDVAVALLDATKPRPLRAVGAFAGRGGDSGDRTENGPQSEANAVLEHVGHRTTR